MSATVEDKAYRRAMGGMPLPKLWPGATRRQQWDVAFGVFGQRVLRALTIAKRTARRLTR